MAEESELEWTVEPIEREVAGAETGFVLGWGVGVVQSTHVNSALVMK